MPIRLVVPLLLLFILSVHTAAAQRQEQTSQGAPLVLIPAITGNILAIVSFLLGTSSFILGLKIQSAAKATTESTPTSTPSTPSALSALTMHKYFDLLILALVIPSVAINIFGILLVGSHLYLQDAPYLLVLLALFIPAGAILFLLKKLRIVYKDKDSINQRS